VSSGYTGQTDRVIVDTYRMTFAVAPDLTYFISVARPDCVPTEVHVYGTIANGQYTYRHLPVGSKYGIGGAPRTPRILEGVQVLTKKLTTKIPLSVWFWPSIALF